MGFLRRDDDDAAQPDTQAQAATPATMGPEEAPHQATYEAGSLAGIVANHQGRGLESPEVIPFYATALRPVHVGSLS